jgi:hypothetical protein
MKLKASVKVREVQVELTKLKEELAKKEAEWKSTQEHHEGTLCILRSQIGEAERQKALAEMKKNDAFDSLLKMTEKAKLFETKLKDKRTVWLLYSS